jgi:tetratricopeptide (TPR) repeat protein
LSLKIIKLEPKIQRFTLVIAALLCLVTAWYFVKWNFANTIAAHLDVKQAEFKPIADWLVEIAPNDPQAHFTAARLYEKTLDQADLTRSIREYEMAVALSPYNYLNWIDLGKARGIEGDADGALAAYERALELAPNYAVVQWAYGNALLRGGKTAEGFSFIAKAAAAKPEYAQPAVQTALQIFDQNIDEVRRYLGDTDTTNAALATALTGQMHFDEAFDAWSKLPDADKASKFKDMSDALIEKFAAARRFQLAAKTAAVRANESERPTIGKLSNGGFEDGVKLRNAGIFEWQIAEGAQPQIGLNDRQPHGGKYSLSIAFNSFETAAFRSVSQTVAVTPGAEYELELYYRSDVKTTAALKFEIDNALINAPITSTESLTAVPDWTLIHVRWKMPADSDGIVIRFVREGCAGPSCPMNGSISFDDISLKQV